ncbi:MAG: ammonium transporter [Candidatus Nanopelagicales bacterium]
MPEISPGDTAWVMISAALVLFMTPGLALFYGGMVRAKSVLNMMMMSFLAMGLVTVIWVLFGFSLAFGEDVGGGLIGGADFIGLEGTLDQVVGAEGNGIPLLAFAMFQLTFAIVTAALLSGAVADRVRIRAWIVFISVWSILVYLPIAHWAFFFDDGAGGWIGDRLGALDFAGGTAVEINSGFSSLALAFVVGRRVGWRRDPMRPHNLPLVLLGAGILWFGWFGFNAGSALAANGLASTAMINTQISTACAALTWVLVERFRDGKATTLGVASGAVAGAVAITPACGFVTPLGALAIGLAAGAICSLAIGLKYRFGYDDSLDVLGVHGVGGLVGMIAIGLFATVAANSGGADGLFYGGGFGLLGKQLLASVATMAFAFGVTWLIAKVIDRTIGFRIAPDDEVSGVDLAEHAESAYDIVGSGGAAGGVFAGVGHGFGHGIGQGPSLGHGKDPADPSTEPQDPSAH